MPEGSWEQKVNRRLVETQQSFEEELRSVFGTKPFTLDELDRVTLGFGNKKKRIFEMCEDDKLKFFSRGGKRYYQLKE